MVVLFVVVILGVVGGVVGLSERAVVGLYHRRVDRGRCGFIVLPLGRTIFLVGNGALVVYKIILGVVGLGVNGDPLLLGLFGLLVFDFVVNSFGVDVGLKRLLIGLGVNGDVFLGRFVALSGFLVIVGMVTVNCTAPVTV